MELKKILQEFEEETGKKVSDKKAKFAVLSATTGKTNTQIAREVTDSPAPNKEGYRLANDPDVQRIKAKIEEYKKYDPGVVTEEFITSGLLKEAIDAENSRDKREALHLLGKTKGMFKDVVETKEMRPDDEFLKDIEKAFGKDAADKAKEELGIDDQDEALPH